MYRIYTEYNVFVRVWIFTKVLICINTKIRQKIVMNKEIFKGET